MAEHVKRPWELGPDGLEPEPDDDSRRKRRRDEKEKPEPEPEPKAEDRDERTAEPEVEPVTDEALESASRRVAVAELVATFPPELRYRVEQALAERGGEWSLEQGRYLFTRLRRMEEWRENGSTVTVTERFSLRRDEPPRRPNREAIGRVATSEGEARDQAVAAIRQELAPRDEIVIRVETASGTETLRLTHEPEPVVESPAQEATVAEPKPETAPVAPAEERSAEPPPADAIDAVIEEAAIISAEPEPDQDVPAEVPEVELAAERAVPVDVTPEPAEFAAAESSQSPEPTEPPPPTKPDPELGELIAEITEAADAGTELPPIAGGEATGPPPRPRHTERPTPLSQPARRPRPRGGREAERRIIDWDRLWPTPERKPDSEMIRRARKMLRVIMARYGLRLTPEMESYLLAIVLAPRIIGGRKVYGLGINRDHLIRVIQTLWLNYPQNAPRIS